MNYLPVALRGKWLLEGRLSLTDVEFGMDRNWKLVDLSALALRLALAASFLSAVADRFGIWGKSGLFRSSGEPLGKPPPPPRARIELQLRKIPAQCKRHRCAGAGGEFHRDTKRLRESGRTEPGPGSPTCRLLQSPSRYLCRRCRRPTPAHR